jgi:hypothetical protein
MFRVTASAIAATIKAINAIMAITQAASAAI